MSVDKKVISVVVSLIGAGICLGIGAKILNWCEEKNGNFYSIYSRDIQVEATLYERYIKRGLDIIISGCGLLLFSPILAISSLLVYQEDPGAVIFRQKRVGINKTYFNIHKLRSMKKDVPDVPTHLLENPDQYILKCGKKLRASSCDELPQLIDILRGRMSIVGPRPALWNQDDLIAEREKYGANAVKPGLTGWAQINGRDELEIDVKARLDGEYVTSLKEGNLKGFLMDCKCFFGTFSSVLNAKGIVEGKRRF